MPGRGLLTSTSRADSVRVPLLAGEVAMTVRGHAIPLVALVTVRSLPPPLTTRGHGREDGEPDVSSRSVWRRLLSPRLLLSLRRRCSSASCGGATMAALPSAVQDLARFFLNLTGSSSLGAVGGVMGVAAPASGVGVQLCPLAPGGGAVAPCAATAIPAGVVDPPAAPAAVPGSSGLQQCQGISRPSRCRHRLSSDETGRAQK